MKKNKNKKSVSTPLTGQKAFKVALPVLIGILFITVTSIVVAIVTSPGKNAQISNGDKTFLKLGEYNITYEKLYGITKYNYGLTEMVAKIDIELLKNESYTDEDIEEVKKNIIFKNLDFDELTDEEKAEKEEEFQKSLVYTGITTDQQYQDYLILQAKRYAYARRVFPAWVEDNDFSATQYLEAFNIIYEDDYTKTATSIVLMFRTPEEAKAVLKKFDVDYNNISSTSGIYLESVNEIRLAELEQAKIDVADQKAIVDGMEEDQEDPLYLEALTKLEELEAIQEKLSKIKYLNRVETELLFIDIYNYLYAYFNGGNVSLYFDQEGFVKPEHYLLKEGEHYEIVTVEAETETDEEENEVVITPEYKHVKWLIEDFSEINENIKIRFTADEATAIDSSFNTQIFSSLDVPEKETFVKSFNTTYRSGSSYTFMAYLFDRFEPEAHKYDFELEDGITDEDTEKVGPTAEIRQEVKEYLIEEYFDSNYQSLMLVLFRQENSLKIYDHFIDAMYASSYNSLHETIFGDGEYTPYKLNKKSSKTYVFEYNSGSQKIKVSADQLFESLKERYGVVSVISLMSTNYIINNKEFNKVYIPATNEVIDKDRLRETLNSFDYMNLYNGTLGSVKEWKYAFENNSFESYGFTKDYTWENFRRDYLQMASDKELAANILIQEAYDLFYPTTYDHSDIEEMIKLAWDKYFSLQVINVLVTVDYNLDGAPDEYVLDEDKEQTHWTNEQMELAAELTNLVYLEAPKTGENGLEAQLTAVVNEFRKAGFDDSKWGKFKQYGLTVKNEAKANYSSDSSLVDEFLDVMNRYYLELEEYQRLGDTLDAPQVMEDVFPTVYGYHQVAIAGSGKRVGAISDDEWHALGNAEKFAELMSFLTEENYEIYLRLTNDDSEDDGEDEMTSDQLNAFATYYDAAVKALKGDAFIDYYFATLRDTKLNNNNGEWSFVDNNDFTTYLQIQAKILEELQEAYDEARGIKADDSEDSNDEVGE